MANQSGSYLLGQILIAAPGMDDPNFAHALVLICEHNDDHAMGLILNDPLPKSITSQVLDDLKAIGTLKSSTKIRRGGPCQPEMGFVLHSADWHDGENSIRLSPDILLTSSRRILSDLAANAGPAIAQLTLGFAGWSGQQLEDEIHEGFWLVHPMSKELVFNQNSIGKKIDIWHQALANLGVEASAWDGKIGHA